MASAKQRCDAVFLPMIGTWAHARSALMLMAMCCLLAGAAEGRLCGAWGCACDCRGMPPAPGARFEQLWLRGGGVNSVDGRYLHGGEDRSADMRGVAHASCPPPAACIPLSAGTRF